MILSLFRAKGQVLPPSADKIFKWGDDALGGATMRYAILALERRRVELAEEISWLHTTLDQTKDKALFVKISDVLKEKIAERTKIIKEMKGETNA